MIVTRLNFVRRASSVSVISRRSRVARTELRSRMQTTSNGMYEVYSRIHPTSSQLNSTSTFTAQGWKAHSLLYTGAMGHPEYVSTKKLVAEFLTREMRARRLNQAALAKQSELSPSLVSQILKQKVGISTETLRKLANGLATDPDGVVDRRTAAEVLDELMILSGWWETGHASAALERGPDSYSPKLWLEDEVPGEPGQKRFWLWFIRQLMQQAQVDEPTLAERSGVAPSRLREILTGRLKPGGKTIERLAMAFARGPSGAVDDFWCARLQSLLMTAVGWWGTTVDEDDTEETRALEKYFLGQTIDTFEGAIVELDRGIRDGLDPGSALALLERIKLSGRAIIGALRHLHQPDDPRAPHIPASSRASESLSFGMASASESDEDVSIPENDGEAEE